LQEIKRAAATHCDNELFDPLFVCNCGSMG
jgi:hypothetical protein